MCIPDVVDIVGDPKYRITKAMWFNPTRIIYYVRTVPVCCHTTVTQLRSLNFWNDEWVAEMEFILNDLGYYPNPYRLFWLTGDVFVDNVKSLLTDTSATTEKLIHVPKPCIPNKRKIKL